MSTDDNLLSGTIQSLSLNDTVFEWYNTTNSIIDLINPLNIYDVIPQRGITSNRTGLSNGFLNFEVNLKTGGGLHFDTLDDYSIKLTTNNLPVESFNEGAQYKFFAEDPSGNLKAITLDITYGGAIAATATNGGLTSGSFPVYPTTSDVFNYVAGKGIRLTGATNSLTIDITPSVVTLSDTQTLTNKSLVAPKITNNTYYVEFRAASGMTKNYSLQLPEADGLPNQFLKTDGSGKLSWASASATGSQYLLLQGDSSSITGRVDLLANQIFQILGGDGLTSSTISNSPTITLNVDSTVVRLDATQVLNNKVLNNIVLGSSGVAQRIEFSTTGTVSYQVILPSDVSSVTTDQVLKISNVTTVGGIKVLTTSWGAGGGGGGGDYSLDVVADTGTGEILNNETFSILGGTGITTLMNTNTLTINLDTSYIDEYFENVFDSETPNIQVDYTTGKIIYSLGEEQVYIGWSGHKQKKISDITIQKILVNEEIPFLDNRTGQPSPWFDNNNDRTLWVLEDADFVVPVEGLPNEYIKGQLILVPES